MESTHANLFRLRVRYIKQGRLKYLGHLELIHTVEQIVRRAGLPYTVTQGFSPHMRIAYTAALPVGTSSICEYFDVYLTELIDVEQALTLLRDAAPKDLLPQCASYVEVGLPALTAQINRVDYLLKLSIATARSKDRRDCAYTAQTILNDWITQDISIPYTRGKKQKSLALGRMLISAQVNTDKDQAMWITLATHCDNEGSLRPEILIAALDQALCGFNPGVDTPIISAQQQQLQLIDSYQVERIDQLMCTDEDDGVRPLKTAVDTPHTSLLSSFNLVGVVEPVNMQE